jgi:hypothetical protein
VGLAGFGLPVGKLRRPTRRFTDFRRRTRWQRKERRRAKVDRKSCPSHRPWGFSSVGDDGLAGRPSSLVLTLVVGSVVGSVVGGLGNGLDNGLGGWVIVMGAIILFEV